MGFLEYSVGSALEGRALTESSTPEAGILGRNLGFVFEVETIPRNPQATVLGAWRALSAVVREEDKSASLLLGVTSCIFVPVTLR